MGRTQHVLRSYRSRSFPRRLEMDLRQEPITRESSRTEKSEKDMRVGRNGLAKLKENRSQNNNGKDGSNRKKGTVERIPDKRTSQNPSRNRTPHQKDPKETETGGKGALEPESGILGLKQPETKAPTALTPITRDRGEDCLLYTSPSPRDGLLSRMPSSA